MYHRIQDNQITASYPLSKREIYLPELDQHIPRAEFESHGIYIVSRQSMELADNEYITGYDLQVIDGRPVEVPQVATYTEAEMAERLQAWRENAQVSALDGLLVLDQYGLATAYQAWTADQARTFAERAFIDKAQTWKRMDPVLIAGAASMGLGDEQLDALFRAAGA